ncbi:hypothetical protein QBC43DRAFT_204848 [Cladorrhinum sp. PSN259]|nr:hypothetical protein QBC43DRAFT_204848 [Cladorrhinum sp. PSN259]
MHFSTTLLSTTLFSLSALAAVIEPIVTAVGINPPESILNATHRGIDIFGPIPSDAVKVNGHWEAEEGTLAHAWIRAQVDIERYEDLLQAQGLPVPAVKKRQGRAEIGVSLWKQDGCRGSVVYFDNPYYSGFNMEDNGGNFFSVSTSRRSLRYGEALELRRGVPEDKCRTHHASINGPQPIGCANVGATQCFRLLVLF